MPQHRDVQRGSAKPVKPPFQTGALAAHMNKAMSSLLHPSLAGGASNHITMSQLSKRPNFCINSESGLSRISNCPTLPPLTLVRRHIFDDCQAIVVFSHVWCQGSVGRGVGWNVAEALVRGFSIYRPRQCPPAAWPPVSPGTLLGPEVHRGAQVREAGQVVGGGTGTLAGKGVGRSGEAKKMRLHEKIRHKRIRA